MIAKDKSLYASILRIALPISVQSMVSFLVNLIDTLMVGSLGENALAGVNLATQFFFIIMVICTGISESANILISQYYGKNDINSIKKIYPIVIKVGAIFSLIALYIGYFHADLILKLFANANDIIAIENGINYLKILAISFPFFIISDILIKTRRAIGSAYIAIYIYPVSLVVNVFANYCLIFGKFGFPELGVTGAAIGTTLARVIEFLLAMIFVFKIDKKIALKFKDLLSNDLSILKRYTKNAIPILTNEVLWVLGSTAVNVIFGKLGKEAVSANAISSIVFQMVSILLFGVASSSLVIIGNEIGKGNIKNAYTYARTFVFIGICMGLIASVTVLMTKDFVISQYNLTEYTITLAGSILKANACILFFQTIAIISGIGILRGGGDGKFVLITEIVCVWFVAVPLGCLMAFYFGAPIFWIFIFARLDEVCKAIIFGIRIFCFKWAKDVTKGA